MLNISINRKIINDLLRSRYIKTLDVAQYLGVSLEVWYKCMQIEVMTKPMINKLAQYLNVDADKNMLLSLLYSYYIMLRDTLNDGKIPYTLKYSNEKPTIIANSNTIKIYCVLLYKCNCEESITISNEYFFKVLGITSKTTIKKCCDLLILMGLIERTTIVDTSQKDVNGKILTKTYCQYKLKPYSEWRAYYEERCNVRRRKK